MKEKRKIIQISLLLSDYQKLKALAEKERLSISALVRYFINKRINDKIYGIE